MILSFTNPRRFIKAKYMGGHMKKLFFVLLISVLVMFLGAGMAPFPAPLVPLDINVDRTDDPPDYQPCTSAPNDCSLRGAISLANVNVDTWDTIRLPAGTYTLDLDYIVHAHEDGNIYGDLDIWGSVTIVGADQDTTIIQTGLAYGTGIDRVFHLLNGAGKTVALSVMTIQNGKIASGDGGAGIYQEGSGNALLTQVTVWGNRAESSANGGGILVEGDMTMDDVTILENTAYGVGGGVYTSLNSNLTMNRSSVILNESGSGAGIYINDDAVLRNVTIYHNMAQSSGPGILQMYDASSLTMYNTTIYGNYLYDYPVTPGGALIYDGSVTVYSSILAALDSIDPCVDYGDMSGFSNISTHTSCGASFTVTDPLLLPAADNGGYTQTARLLFGSPALDGGNNSYCLLEDQRGVIRPIDGDGDGTATCDIGGYEAYPIAAFIPLVRMP
jgi:hypothetical protein